MKISIACSWPIASASSSSDREPVKKTQKAGAHLTCHWLEGDKNFHSLQQQQRTWAESKMWWSYNNEVQKGELLHLRQRCTAIFTVARASSKLETAARPGRENSCRNWGSLRPIAAWNGVSRATSDQRPKTNNQTLPSPRLFFPSKKWIKIIPKTIGNRERDCAWGGSGW